MTPLPLVLTAFLGLSTALLPPTSANALDPLQQDRTRLMGLILEWSMNLDKYGPETRARHLPGLEAVRRSAEAARTQEDLGRSEMLFDQWRMAVLAELYPGLRSVFIALPGKEPAPLPQGQSALSGRGGSVERLKARLGDVSDASSLNRLFDNAGRTRAEFSPAPPAPAPVVADPISAARSRFAEVEKLLRGRGASQRVIDLTINEAVRQKADPLLVLAMVQAESNFRTRAVSSCGARGLMQLIPSTAKDMGVDDPDALFDPRVNLRAGVRYLKWLWGRFATLSFSDLIKADLSGSASAQKAVAAYNAGPGNVRKYGGIPPFKETRNYVAKIVRTYKELRQAFLSAV